MLCPYEERCLKSFLESVGFAKVIEFVGILFSKNTVLDEDEYNFSDVMAFFDAPVLKDGGAHWPIFLENVVAESKKKFVSAHMTVFIVGSLGKAIDRKIKSFPDKKVGSGLEALLLLNN